jgi:hypothetical protein
VKPCSVGFPRVDISLFLQPNVVSITRDAFTHIILRKRLLTDTDAKQGY